MGKSRKKQNLDGEIEKCLAQFPSVTEQVPPASNKKHRRRATHPPFDLHSHLYRITGVDFTTIDGLDVVTVQTIISEVGLDPTKFKTVKPECFLVRLMSWLSHYWRTGQKLSNSQSC
jgi:hypothetical protein